MPVLVPGIAMYSSGVAALAGNPVQYSCRNAAKLAVLYDPPDPIVINGSGKKFSTRQAIGSMFTERANWYTSVNRSNSRLYRVVTSTPNQEHKPNVRVLGKPDTSHKIVNAEVDTRTAL